MKGIDDHYSSGGKTPETYPTDADATGGRYPLDVPGNASLPYIGEVPLEAFGLKSELLIRRPPLHQKRK